MAPELLSPPTETNRTVADAADAEMRRTNEAVFDLQRSDRHAERKIAGAPGEFVETGSPSLREQWQADLGQQFVDRKRGREGALEKRVCLDHPFAAHASCYHLGAERRRHEAPFGGRIGVGDAARKG